MSDISSAMKKTDKATLKRMLEDYKQMSAVLENKEKEEEGKRVYVILSLSLLILSWRCLSCWVCRWSCWILC
jgi:hypothetical protein